MSELLTGDGRTHVSSELMRESLVSKKLLAKTDNHTIRVMVPNVHMVTVGGQSIMDRGSEAILPLIDEIAQLIPVLLAVDTPATITILTGGDNVAHRLYGQGDSTFLVAVNTTREPANASFTIPDSLTARKVHLGTTQPTLRNGTIQLDLAPMAVSVLELGK